jgi:hypothetical protein
MGNKKCGGIEVPMQNYPAETRLVNRRSIIQTGVILVTALLFGVFLPILFGTGANGCRLGPRIPLSGKVIASPGEAGEAR